MTKTAFANMASRFRYVLSDPTKDRQTVLACINEFCIMASQFNPRFDRAKFELACGIEVTV